MNDLDKLRVMLPHWIEHNQSHASEFLQWQEKLITENPEVADLLATAVRSLKDAQTALEETLSRAGGALKSGHDGNNEHHHHHHHG